jgi:hypothetical protein
MKETIGSHGKIYVLFESDGKTSVKQISIREYGEDSRAWSTSRNNIKIGRLVRSILKVSGVSFIEKDIEMLINIRRHLTFPKI